MSTTPIGTFALDGNVHGTLPLLSNKLPDRTDNVFPTLKVMHVVNGEYFSGAERVQLHLAHRLSEFNIQADFVCLKPGKLIEQFDAPTSRLTALDMRSRFDVTAGHKLATLVRRERYQLLHAHTPRSAMIAAIASRLTGTPWVYHVHSPAARDSAKHLSNRMNDWVERLSLTTCSHLITVSQSLCREMLSKGWSDRDVTVVHNGVPAICPERERWPQVGNEWMICMVALMRPRKGLEVLLDALRCVLNTGLELRLRCIGPFETTAYEQLILARVRQLNLTDHVEFTGFAHNVAGELAKVDALVLPSLYGEGLPMVVLEAMAAGLPVVATKVEGTPEAIRHGCEGLLAEPNSPGSLAAQLAALVQGDVCWEDLSIAAKARHAAHFSDRSMAEGVAGVYRRVVG